MLFAINVLLYYDIQIFAEYESHPTWVRGLKLLNQIKFGCLLSRTPRGCVD